MHGYEVYSMRESSISDTVFAEYHHNITNSPASVEFEAGRRIPDI